jgi:microcystin-dependent protein
MTNPFIGQVNSVGFNFAPRGWTLCDGQLLSITSNTALFSLLGTTFGGDGRSTFGLPDLRGRSIVGVGTGAGLTPISSGERGGSTSITITTAHMPSHTHSLRGSNNEANATSPANALLAVDVEGYVSGKTANLSMQADAIQNTGGGQPLTIRNPFLGLYMCIALQGTYPSRN